VKVKGFSYRRLVDRRDRVYRHALRQYVGSRLVGGVLTDVCDDVYRELPQSASRDALFESIRVLAGMPLTQRAAKELAWRLAGNLDRLNNGERVLPWTRQIADETVPVRVERIQSEKRRNEPGYILSLRVLAGSPCPLVFPVFFTRRSCATISKTLGFSAPWGNYPYSTALHYVGLLFFVDIEAAKSHENIFVASVSNTDSLVNENRSKIEVRTRARPCPRGYQHECTKCWLGYNECPAAIWPQTLVQRECTQCQKEEFFEHDDQGTVCLNCRAATVHHAH
jgi:hypothetical protein